jgi:hypothetical protein
MDVWQVRDNPLSLALLDRDGRSPLPDRFLNVPRHTFRAPEILLTPGGVVLETFNQAPLSLPMVDAPLLGGVIMQDASSQPSSPAPILLAFPAGGVNPSHDDATMHMPVGSLVVRQLAVDSHHVQATGHALLARTSDNERPPRGWSQRVFIYGDPTSAFQPTAIVYRDVEKFPCYVVESCRSDALQYRFLR